VSTTDNVNIREIVARFQNSAEVIDELRGRLQSLARTDDLHGVSLRTAQVAAQALEESSGQLRTAIDLMRNSLLTADSALTTATAFMRSTDLSQVSRQLQSLEAAQAESNKTMTTAIDEVRNSVKADVQSIMNFIESLRDEEGAAWEERVAILQRELDDLRSRIAQIPERARNKYGL
jgi:hypothetical protein